MTGNFLIWYCHATSDTQTYEKQRNQYSGLLKTLIVICIICFCKLDQTF